MSPDWEWEAEVQQRGRRLKADHTDRSRAEQRALSLDLRLQQLHDLKTLTAVLFVHQSSQARHYDVKKRATNLICISLLRTLANSSDIPAAEGEPNSPRVRGNTSICRIAIAAFVESSAPDDETKCLKGQ